MFPGYLASLMTSRSCPASEAALLSPIGLCRKPLDCGVRARYRLHHFCRDRGRRSVGQGGAVRLGHFRSLQGSGLFFIIPVIDAIAYWIDIRVITTSFTAEKTLANDTGRSMSMRR